jgi:hypothetical protein
LIDNQKRLRLLLGVPDEEEIEEVETIVDEVYEEDSEIKFEEEMRQDSDEQHESQEHEPEQLDEAFEDSMTETVEEDYVEEIAEYDDEHHGEIVVEQQVNDEDEENPNEEYELVYEEDQELTESIEVQHPKKRKKYSKKLQIFKCWMDGCDQKFGFRSSIKRHMLQTHQYTITKSTCLLCGNFYQNYSDYLSHVKIHTRNSKCDICMMTFIDDEKLAKHKDRIHDSKKDKEDRIYECAVS